MALSLFLVLSIWALSAVLWGLIKEWHRIGFIEGIVCASKGFAYLVAMYLVAGLTIFAVSLVVL